MNLFDTVYANKSQETKAKNYIRQHGEAFNRCFASWTRFEDMEIKAKIVKDNMTVEEIAAIHKRTVRSIVERLKHLGVRY